MIRPEHTLLLPYAYNGVGEETHIDNAVKGEKYTCPVCGEELLLRKSKIPKGEKYHRRNHFVHKSGNLNQCSESYLHKRFKQRIIELINNRISAGVHELTFGWHCDECGEYHKGNLLKKAICVAEEYDMGVCRPDIALLDKHGRVVIVIEIVVTHKPEENVLSYYKENNIVCLQLFIKEFDVCDDISQKLLSVDEVNRCPNPICSTCGKRTNHAYMYFIDTLCWRCGEEVKLALIRGPHGEIIDSTGFNNAEIEIANQYGASIKEVRTKDRRSAFYNICNRCTCHNYSTSFNLERLYDSDVETIDLGMKCFHCLWKTKPQCISFFR